MINELYFAIVVASFKTLSSLSNTLGGPDTVPYDPSPRRIIRRFALVDALRNYHINIKYDDLLASTSTRCRWTWLDHAPPTNANQHDLLLLPKRYIGIQRPLGLSDDWSIALKNMRYGS
jgi:hypothetical protein